MLLNEAALTTYISDALTTLLYLCTLLVLQNLMHKGQKQISTKKSKDPEHFISCPVILLSCFVILLQAQTHGLCGDHKTAARV